jgi:hypothetical protein
LLDPRCLSTFAAGWQRSRGRVVGNALEIRRLRFGEYVPRARARRLLQIAIAGRAERSHRYRVRSIDSV